MLPDHVLSTTPIKGKYLVPDTYVSNDLVDYEMGGVAIQDPSKGLMFQVWKLECLSNKHILLSSATQARHLIISGEYVTEISLAFDQNMRPFVAYVDNEQAKYWWFDARISGPRLSMLPSGSKHPRACLDDKRLKQTQGSDILLAYIRDNILYFREQRDRFEIEYPLASNIQGKLDRVGMTDKSRLQFRIIPYV